MQVSGKKLERWEMSCGADGQHRGTISVRCINAEIFRILDRMVHRSSALVRSINRILPTDPRDARRAIPASIHVDERLLSTVSTI